ncbi:hypothetical protein E5676_scaffold68G00640 [Cucumis melo var. makuwa]|uniref:Uncharacterized protein n=1 Tax=Cucumis melo var. makuwa TaxID=1194695 RepID=A0A5A7SMF4_CUCMM|nr:hypothetical protein E6C27_scaffold417G00050 [Cucumis melo var. makuwa]TYK04762.1 hypothetical protein E5676_scaffold68G00640 [Cucumis melo var. makuwa]
MLKHHKKAIGWTLEDVQGISLSYCMHKIRPLRIGEEIVEPTEGLVKKLLSQPLITESTESGEEIVKVILWPDHRESTPMGKLQLYPHQLTTEVNVWLFFIKIPTNHDSTVSIEYTLLVCDNLTKQAFNLGFIMQGALFA